METVLWIGLGGFAGANLRYFVSGWVAQQAGAAFPWGTLLVNFTGSAGLAVVLAWMSGRVGLDPRLRLMVTVGFFGGYTTFSTFANESIALFRAGDWAGAAFNLVGTNLICLAGVVVGLIIGSRL